MPILPIDHPEPFAATLGIMLYPSEKPPDPQKADTFTGAYLVGPLKEFRRRGLDLRPEAEAIITPETGASIKDWPTRWRHGIAAGEVYRRYISLAAQTPKFASLNRARELHELEHAYQVNLIQKNNLKIICRIFRPVMHLWAALPDLQHRIAATQEDNYSVAFEQFLLDAHALLVTGQQWRHKRNAAKPLLDAKRWRFPDGWKSPLAGPGWPEQVLVPGLTLDESSLQGFRTAGRPLASPKQ